jgi:predicted RNA methylase
MAHISLFDTLLRKAAWTWFNLTDRDDLLKVYQRKAKRQIIREHAELLQQDKDVQAAIAYLKKHALLSIPYPFIEEYHSRSIPVFRDMNNGLPYVLHENKKLFFRRSDSNRDVQQMYNHLLVEQDPRSPHRYTDASFAVAPGDTLLDIGCAEGNFSLSSVETAKHIILFEGDPEWIEALEATFAPWRHKVTIVPKWVGDADDEATISIDSFLLDFRGADTPFFKLDVEGHEREVLKGMQQQLDGGRPMKMALCTYHRADDYADFTALLADKGFALTPTDGVMLIQMGAPPYFRKGVLKAVRR